MTTTTLRGYLEAGYAVTATLVLVFLRTTWITCAEQSAILKCVQPNRYEKGGVMEVYVVERGCYEDRHILGIYATVELAMGACPGKKWTRTVWAHHPKWPDVSEVTHHQTWENELDWNEACSISVMEIEDSGPLRSVDETLLQEHAADGRSISYRPIANEEANVYAS